MNEAVDAVIVGGGIAGLSAALFLSRAGRKVVVYDNGRSRIFSVPVIREHLGFDGQPTGEFAKSMRSEATRYGAHLRIDTVSSVTPREDGLFQVETERETLVSRSIILATGVVDELPRVDGLREQWGRDLRVCPCFDGHEVAGKRFVVFGLPSRLAQMASWVWMWSKDVTAVTTSALSEKDSKRLELLGIKLVSGEVTALMHDGDEVAGVRTASGGEIACDAVWIAANIKAASPLAATLCDVDDNGIALVDSGGRTSRPGVFAIGNASDPVAHLAHASAAGTNVGPVVTLYLLERILEERRRLDAAE